MRIRKIKRKGRSFFIKIALPILVLLILSALLLYFLPTLSLFKKPIISPLAKNKSSQTPNLETLLKNAKVPFVSISQSADYYIVMLSDGGQIFISSKKDLTSQISSLQLIFNRLTIEGKRIKSLDFRFDKPIIKF
ncbi:MAG: hypothetical protein A3B44_03365 [Candidatus Levybacteria bacterium RIFCSPLOWO2_01_FULL_38_21]|nr:MAG: hypothetical protein A3B44_03365 [Candidatus Levybacteria bacterium RIFCSPLOWO2_01_FULL_38_21]